MPFIGINEQNKQRVNISKETAIIIDQDIKDFNLANRNVLINNLISYIEENNLTKNAELLSYKKALLLNYEKLNIDMDYSMIVDGLCNLKKKEIVNELSANGTHKRNQFGFYFRISNDVRRWLENPSNKEDEYYLSLEHFLNCTIEEYAAYDYFLRESIACKERIAVINNYISNKQWIDLYNTKRMPTRIYPVKIIPDINRTHIYLTAISIRNENEFVPITFRISSLDISRIRPVYDLPPCAKEYISILNEQIQERGVQFLSLPTADIKVRLNYYGVKTYNRTRNLRPNYTKITEDTDGTYIYEFQCTEKQAEFYFMSFGSNAEILSPDSLRNTFKQNYQFAYQKYAD